MPDQFIPYTPPLPTLHDTLLAYQSLIVPQMGVVVADDPLGPVNKIVRLVRRDRGRDHVIKTVLTHIPDGAHVRVDHITGRPRVTVWDSLWNEVATDPGCPPGWIVAVDDRVVLRATAAECQPPTPVGRAIPWRERARRAITRRARAAADRIADRLGYLPADEEAAW